MTIGNICKADLPKKTKIKANKIKKILHYATIKILNLLRFISTSPTNISHVFKIGHLAKASVC